MPAIEEMLQSCPEPLPEWLDGAEPPRFDRKAFFASRSVCFPESGDDGQPMSSSRSPDSGFRGLQEASSGCSFNPPGERARPSLAMRQDPASDAAPECIGSKGMKFVSFAVLAFAIAGCGGGSPSSPPSSTPPSTGSTEVKSDLEMIIASAVSKIKLETNDGILVLRQGPYPVAGETLATLQGTAGGDDSQPEYHALEVRAGVSRAHSTDSSTPFAGETLHANRFAGWMSYSAFLVDRTVLAFDDPAENGLDETFIHSIGSPSNSSPVTDGASWQGIMAGFDLREESAVSLVEGEARIAVDNFSEPMVNILFSNIRNQSTGSMLPDMVWNGLSLTNGTFADPGLTGQFYGPGHEEVGGVFFRESISGAFGASR